MSFSLQRNNLVAFFPRFSRPSRTFDAVLTALNFALKNLATFLKQVNTYSSSKHTNTYKCMIACTPNGACFVSDLFEGDISDVQIFEESAY